MPDAPTSTTSTGALESKPSPAVEPGYYGNLTSEHVKALKLLYRLIFNDGNHSVLVNADQEDLDGAAKSPTNAAHSPNAGTSSPTKSHPSSPNAKSPISPIRAWFHHTDHLEAAAYTSIKETLFFTIGELHPDRLLLRFLRAKRFNVIQAYNLFIKALQWRDSLNVFTTIMQKGEQILNKDELKIGKLWVYGKDLKGQPAVWVDVGLHFPRKTKLEETIRLCVWSLEQGRLLLDPNENVETPILIFDLTRFGFSNVDLKLVKFVVDVFQKYYPECIGSLLVLNAPRLFSSIWNVVKGTIDPLAAKKIFFVTTESLRDWIPPEFIPAKYGGELQWKYEYMEPTGDEGPVEGGQEEIQNWHKACDEFRDVMTKWSTGHASEDEKTAAVMKLQKTYLEAAKYFRAKGVYHRLGLIRPDRV